jgi:hypothetical protein
MPERLTKLWQGLRRVPVRLVLLILFPLALYALYRFWPDFMFGTWWFLKRSWNALAWLFGNDFLRLILGIGSVLVFYAFLRWGSWLLKTFWHSLLWFLKDSVARLALGLALIIALYAMARLWQDFATGALCLLKGFWRGLEWVLGSEAARSLLGVFTLFWLYGLGYRYLFLRDKLFITIAPFRVWGNLRSAFLGKDIAARLSDELTQLQREQREVSTDAGVTPVIAGGGRSLAAKPAPSPAVPLHVEQAVPEVGVQYEGISPEAVNAFWRRFFDRRVLITGDVIPTNGGLLMVARSVRHGTWEAQAQTRDASALHAAVEELAVRAIIDLQGVG